MKPNLTTIITFLLNNSYCTNDRKINVELAFIGILQTPASNFSDSFAEMLSFAFLTNTDGLRILSDVQPIIKRYVICKHGTSSRPPRPRIFTTPADVVGIGSHKQSNVPDDSLNLICSSLCWNPIE